MRARSEPLVLGAVALLFAAQAAAAPLRMPAATRARLGNGLQVVVVPTSRLPLVDFRMVVRAGSVNDPPGKEGLAGLTAELMTQGAGPRDARRIAEDIAFVGGTLAAGAGREQIVVTCEVLKKDVATGLELFRDVVVSPRFPAEELSRKRDEALGEIESAKNDPETVADLALGPFLLGESPLAHPVIGEEGTVRGLSRDDVAGFHEKWVRPGNAMLAVVGDVDPQATIAALEKAFAAWKGSSDTRAAYAPVPQPRGRQVRIVSQPELSQAQIRMACMGVPRNHPDHDPIQVANAILSGGFLSRLVNEIRVRQGLTYDIASHFGMYRNGGTFEISTSTRNEALRKTIEATLAEVRKLLDQGPTVDELERAKRYLTGQFPIGLQAPDALAAQLLDVEFYGLGPGFLESYQDRIAAVPLADVRRALKSYVCVDDLRILVVANPTVARVALEGLGPIDAGTPE